MKLTSIALSIMLEATNVLYAGQQTLKHKPNGVKHASENQRKSWDDLRKRFVHYSEFISGQLWSLIHTYESEAEMKQSLKLFESVSVALASNNPSSIRKFDGPMGFKSQLLQFMKSKDDTVSGFAATILAITGDLNYAPQIAGLLKRKDRIPEDNYSPITARGRAAVALSLLGAKQYTEQI